MRRWSAGCRPSLSRRTPFTKRCAIACLRAANASGPLLCLAAAEAVADFPQGIEQVACTLEMIHTYSLIHDDLPAHG